MQLISYWKGILFFKTIETVVFVLSRMIDVYLSVTTVCPNTHGNSVTNLISSLSWFSIEIPNFKSHNIIMSAKVYFMKTVTGCKDVSIMSPQDEQWRRTSLLFLYTVFFCFTKYNRMQSKHKQTNCKHSRRKAYGLRLSQ